jgi:protein TonB
MATNDIQPTPGGEPELNLLLSKDVLDESLWKSLVQNLNDFFFPKKQAPLVLTSKPIPVKDIWGFYNYKKNGALGSTIVHIAAVALIIGGTLITFHHPPAAKPPEVVTLIAPDDIPPLSPSKT